MTVSQSQSVGMVGLYGFATLLLTLKWSYMPFSIRVLVICETLVGIGSIAFLSEQKFKDDNNGRKSKGNDNRGKGNKGKGNDK